MTEETNLLTLAKKPSVTAQTWRSVAVFHNWEAATGKTRSLMDECRTTSDDDEVQQRRYKAQSRTTTEIRQRGTMGPTNIIICICRLGRPAWTKSTWVTSASAAKEWHDVVDTSTRNAGIQQPSSRINRWLHPLEYMGRNGCQSEERTFR